LWVLKHRKKFALKNPNLEQFLPERKHHLKACLHYDKNGSKLVSLKNKKYFSYQKNPYLVQFLH
jgi:hypothetical protein